MVFPGEKGVSDADNCFAISRGKQAWQFVGDGPYSRGELSMIVVLTEEPSSAEMLKRVIPKILPDMLPQLDLQIVEHRGIGDLKAKLPSLLRGWPGDARFIVVCDRDRDRKSTRLNSSHGSESRMPSSA